MNVISWSGVHNSESGNAHQNSASNDVLAAAIIPTWSAASGTSFGTYTAPAAPLYTASSPGSAIFGHYVAVVDKTDILHVYDLRPGEDLDSDGNPDDGIQDYRNGTSYDEIWRSASLGDHASGPTIATMPAGGEPLVLVEHADGSVWSYNLTTGATVTQQMTAAAASYTTSNAPAPTWYNGRLYAGRADGTVAIHDYSSGQRWVFTLAPDPTLYVSTNYQPVTAPPAVAMNWVSGDSNQTDNNDLVLYITTSRFIYTIFMASYNENLVGNNGTYLTKISNTNPPSEIDVSPPQSWRAFALDPYGYESMLGNWCDAVGWHGAIYG